MIQDPKLATEKIQLRPWSLDEADQLARLVADEAISRWTLIPPNLTPDQARDWIRRRADRQREGMGVALAVVPAGQSSTVGTVGIGRSPEAGRAELYYWLGVEARGRGLAREAVSLLCSWAWLAMELDRISVTIHADNEASLRLAVDLGFRETGVVVEVSDPSPGESTAPLREWVLERPNVEIVGAHINPA